MHHVRRSDTRELRAVVHDTLARSNKHVENDEAIVVHQRDTREGGLGTVNPYSNHFAVECEVFTRSGVRSVCAHVARAMGIRNRVNELVRTRDA